MKKKLNCILLVDDSPDDNHYHQIVINEMDITNSIQVSNNGLEAIEFLKKENQIIPELIFLDINMPKMNGWEFLEKYKYLEVTQKAKIIVMMLSTSTNPDDIKKAKEIEEVTGFQTKPMTRETITEILDEYFSDYK
jgi:CheY-like chemotaxis protein